MTSDAIRETMARLDGWTSVGYWARAGLAGGPPGRPDDLVKLKRYTSSLDAVMPLIRALDPAIQCRVYNHLHRIVAHPGNTHVAICHSVVRATAAQWAEAYLRTVGKWVESPSQDPR